MSEKKETKIIVAKSFKARGKEWSKDEKEEVIEVRLFETAPAEVGISYGLTLNLGNFESARLDVSLKVPCYKEEIEEVFVKAEAFVTGKVKAESEEIKGGGKGQPSSI